MSRFTRRDREAVISRLDRLLWIMESVATGGWSKGPITRRAPQASENTPGDRVVSTWYDRLTTKIDDLVEHYLRKLDDREEQLVGTTFEIQAAYRHKDSSDKCPSCGASTKSAGSF